MVLRMLRNYKYLIRMFGDTHDIFRFEVEMYYGLCVHVSDAITYLPYKSDTIWLLQIKIIVYYSFK